MPIERIALGKYERSLLYGFPPISPGIYYVYEYIGNPLNETTYKKFKSLDEATKFLNFETDLNFEQIIIKTNKRTK